jgi:hypothetical protein
LLSIKLFKEIIVYVTQFIAVSLLLIRKEFVLEKGLDPKKPLFAERGEGCGPSIMRWSTLLIF